VARRGALALDNARLYGRQLAVAETLQRSLLTPPTHADPLRLQIAVRYRPAGRYQEVGGDWYDAFVQPDGATALVIGDVVGHDVAATAAMSQIRSMLRALANDRPGSPAHILARLDRVLTGLHVDAMATALLARVEPPDPEGHDEQCLVRWSSAGHPPPLVLSADGRVRVLDGPAQRLLGTSWTGIRRDDEVRLDAGDTLLLITDGLLEQGRLDLDQGMSRLTAALSACTQLSVEELCDRLLDAVVSGRADDDIALLALRCCP
jgi:serine phosphatase RsbU (regulator of sigma subunit)